MPKGTCSKCDNGTYLGRDLCYPCRERKAARANPAAPYVMPAGQASAASLARSVGVCPCGTRIYAADRDKCSRCYIRTFAPEARVCACGQTFQTKRPNHVDCTPSCRQLRISTYPIDAECAVCGDLFLRLRANHRTCGKRCFQADYRRRNPAKHGWGDVEKAAYHRRRARKKMGSAGERIVPGEVFQRDGWRCGICNRAVKSDLAYPHPRSASLDHILPLSKGGTHTLANVQLAHLDCNLGKRDRVENVQLRMIG